MDKSMQDWVQHTENYSYIRKLPKCMIMRIKFVKIKNI